ncbi:MAG: helix-turn-helix transcriptional regulator [Chloroflexi bacterium]|nr:helix-turn-helix transcriptional regulator [Chloroflexota bacterium]
MVATGPHQDKTKRFKSPTQLTKRQKQCLQRVAVGNTLRTIAKQLGITERMVRGHLSKVRKKLDARSTAEAVYIAVKLDILE